MSPSVVRAPRWLSMAFVMLVLAAGSAVAAWSIEFPYFALSAGPVYDVVDNVEVIDGVESFPPEGELMMLTVSLQGVNAYEMLAAAVDPTVDLLRQERLRSPDESDEEYRERNLAAMDQSKENAIAVALDRLGDESLISSDGVQVMSLIDGAPAASVLQEDDVIVEVEGQPIDVAQEIGELLSDNAPGDLVPLVILRAGVRMEVEVRLFEAEDEPGRPLVGILAQTVNPRFPVDINSENVGGPSAGLMYALGIMDVLTPGAITNGHIVAGTGTIAPDGTVGGIGGIRQKVVAAEAAGAEYMFVPQSNYDDAITAPVDDLQLVAVGSIDEAIEFLEGLPEA
ncbi:MAG: PDZ domain-containing protein [Acidimicrobiia bacterium]|nr:PDZ domain-containing protein [Acidimicrobiia bacterium]